MIPVGLNPVLKCESQMVDVHVRHESYFTRNGVIVRTPFEPDLWKKKPFPLFIITKITHK